MKAHKNAEKYKLTAMVQGRLFLAVLAMSVVLTVPDQARADNTRGALSHRTAGHPAAGSWFGKAVQLTDGVTPGIALYMTPTISPDGMFLGNDSLSLGALPFGPHTTAHGRWAPVDRKTIVADYLFMLPGPPDPSTDPPTSSIVAARLVWLATVVGRNTMVGYVNIKIGAPIPENWEPLAPTDNPTLPEDARALTEAPEKIYTDPAEAPPGTLVFKFHIARVQPTAPPARENPRGRN